MWVWNKAAIPPCTTNLLKVVICVGGVTNDDDVVNVRKVHANHQDVGRDDDSTTIRSPHQVSCLGVVIWPVECVVCSELFASNINWGIELLPEVRENTETIPDACTENEDLLLLHGIDDPSKVRKLPVLDTVAEDAKEELDFRSVVGPLYHVIIIPKADKAGDPFGLFTRKQRRCHCNHDQAQLKAGAHELDLEVGLSEAATPCIEKVCFIDREQTDPFAEA